MTNVVLAVMCFFGCFGLLGHVVFRTVYVLSHVVFWGGGVLSGLVLLVLFSWVV